MSSQIFVRAKLSKKFDKVTFSGESLRVLELKMKILLKKKMDKAGDFKVELRNAQTNEIYADDEELVPRNTQVIFKRVPAKPSTTLSAVKAEPNTQSSGANSAEGAADRGKPLDDDDDDELDDGDSALLASIQANMADYRPNLNVDRQLNNAFGANSDATPSAARLVGAAMGGAVGAAAKPKAEEGSRQSNRRPRGGYQDLLARQHAAHQSRRPPPNYVCDRCGIKGHWIHQCPTNDDPAYDKVRQLNIKGKPRSAVQEIDEEEAAKMTADGQQVVRTTWGGYGLVVSNTSGFKNLKDSSAHHLEGLFDRRDVPEHVQCKVCQRLMRDPVMTPCCSETGCGDCITAALVRNGLVCPFCNAPGISQERVLQNKAARNFVDAYIRDYKASLEAKAEVQRTNEPKPLPVAPDAMDQGVDAVVSLVEAKADAPAPPPPDREAAQPPQPPPQAAEAPAEGYGMPAPPPAAARAPAGGWSGPPRGAWDHGPMGHGPPPSMMGAPGYGAMPPPPPPGEWSSLPPMTQQEFYHRRAYERDMAAKQYGGFAPPQHANNPGRGAAPPQRPPPQPQQPQPQQPQQQQQQQQPNVQQQAQPPAQQQQPQKQRDEPPEQAPRRAEHDGGFRKRRYDESPPRRDRRDADGGGHRDRRRPDRDYDRDYDRERPYPAYDREPRRSRSRSPERARRRRSRSPDRYRERSPPRGGYGGRGYDARDREAERRFERRDRYDGGGRREREWERRDYGREREREAERDRDRGRRRRSPPRSPGEQDGPRFTVKGIGADDYDHDDASDAKRKRRKRGGRPGRRK